MTRFCKSRLPTSSATCACFASRTMPSAADLSRSATSWRTSCTLWRRGYRQRYAYCAPNEDWKLLIVNCRLEMYLSPRPAQAIDDLQLPIINLQLLRRRPVQVAGRPPHHDDTQPAALGYIDDLLLRRPPQDCQAVFRAGEAHHRIERLK